MIRLTFSLSCSDWKQVWLLNRGRVRVNSVTLMCSACGNNHPAISRPVLGMICSRARHISYSTTVLVHAMFVRVLFFLMAYEALYVYAST
jgi:hypothetical protein